MKKIILLVLTIFMVSCSPEKLEMHKYEILLSTKDTIYVDASYFLTFDAVFTSERTVVFKDTIHRELMVINNPVYIKEIK